MTLKNSRKELAFKYRNEIANPYIADEKGYIDEVIDPADTRKNLSMPLKLLENKHVNVPLQEAWKYSSLN